MSPLARMAGVACVAMIATAVPSVAEAAPTTEHEAQLDEGARLSSEGRAVEAAAVLTSAYRALAPSERVRQLGEYTVALANDAYAEAGSEPELLRANRELLREYFEAIDAARAEGREVECSELFEQQMRARLAELDRAIEALERESAERSRAAAEPAPVIAADAPEREPPRTLGVALLAGGSVALAGGLALTTQGARFPGLIDEARREALTSYGLTANEAPASWDEHERRQRTRGHALLGSGIALASLGVGAIVWGTVRLVTKRSSDRRRARVVPAVGVVALRF